MSVKASCLVWESERGVNNSSECKKYCTIKQTLAHLLLPKGNFVCASSGVEDYTQVIYIVF